MNQNGQAGTNALVLRDTGSLRVKGAGPTELEKARQEASRARADALAAQERADQARERLLKNKRDTKMRLRATAVIMLTAALLRLAWEASNTQPPAPVASAVQPIAQGTAGALPEASTTETTQAELALDRLRDAFSSFPDEDQPAVVSEVNARYAGTEFSCPLAWSTKGMPTLSVGGNGGSQPIIARAANQCAAGVEKLRSDRAAAARKETR